MGTGHENAERTVNPFRERGKRLSVAKFRSRSQSSESREGSALPESVGLLPKEDGPCSHICNCASCNFYCLCYQPSILLNISRTNITIAERSRRTGCAFFYRSCILFSISYDSYELDLCRGEPLRPWPRCLEDICWLLGAADS